MFSINLIVTKNKTSVSLCITVCWTHVCATLKFEALLGETYGATARLQLWGISTVHKCLPINGLTETQNNNLDLLDC